MKGLIEFEERAPFVASLLHRLSAYVFTYPAVLFGTALRGLRGRPLRKEMLSAKDVRSILLTRVDGLGDLVLFSAFIREIRGRWPKAHITMVVDKRFLSLFEACPYADEVIGFNEEGSKYARLILGPLRAFTLARSRLWARNFDLAINPRWDVDSRHAALIGYLSLAKHHFGFSERINARKRMLNRGLDHFYSHLIASEEGTKHEAERNGEVLRSLRIPADSSRNIELWLTEADRNYAAKVMAENGITSATTLVCLGIGAKESKRRWPVDRFASVAAQLRKTLNARFLVIGDSEDARNAQQMRSVLGSALINQAGSCSVRQSSALLAYCGAYLGNDSGPMHLAAAMGVPVVEISCHPLTASDDHVNSPLRYAPLTHPLRILRPEKGRDFCMNDCSSLTPHCILNVATDQVEEAIYNLLTREVSQNQAVALARR